MSLLFNFKNAIWTLRRTICNKKSAFGASCINRASVFEWHKRSKEVRESVKDDERCGRWKWLWRRSLTRSHKRTSIGPSRSCWNCTTNTFPPEDITPKGTRVWFVYPWVLIPLGKVWIQLFSLQCSFYYDSLKGFQSNVISLLEESIVSPNKDDTTTYIISSIPI